MSQKAISAIMAAIIVVALLSGTTVDAGPTSVFNLGPGYTSLEFVPVGNPGNAGELSGTGAGGWGLDAIVGAVADPYLIGKYAVTAGQYTMFLNAVAATDTYELYNELMWSSSYPCKIDRSGDSGSYTYSVASGYANRPVNFVSFWDAARFANWLHNGQPTGLQGQFTTEDGAYINIGNQELFSRQPGAQYWIPTEDEWYKAAYHKNDGVTDNYWLYPTGSDSVPSNQLIDPDPGNNATFITDGNYTTGSPYWRTEVGAHENSASPYGTFDQGGNVWEWNETTINSSRGLRGGSFHSGSDINLRASSRNYHDPSWEYGSLGFRVAKVVPEPGDVAALVGVGAVGFLWFWRRR